MQKLAKATPTEIFAKLKEIPEQAKINQQLRAEETLLIAEYRKTYGKQGLYKGLLAKLQLVAKDENVIPLIEATVGCPEAFCFDYKRGKPKPLVFFEVTTGDTGLTFEEPSMGGVDFCTLTLTPKGTMNLLVAETDGYFQTLDFQDPQGISLLLNLPYLLGEVINNENFSKIKQKLLAFVKSNPTCTLANIYNYAKTAPEGLAALPENVAGLESAEDIFSGGQRNFAAEAIKAFFLVKNKRFQEQEIFIKYLIEKEENGEIVVNMDYANSWKEATWKANYPVKILVKAEKFIPMFLPDSFFYALETQAKDEKPGPLLSKAAKLANIMAGYQLRQAADTDLPGTEAFYKEELTYRTEKVMTALKKFLTAQNISNINEKEQKNLETLKTSQASVAEKVKIISKILAETYKKEIVLSNL